ncbi:MAG: hypothetical protein QXP36_07875 [Conexivisphaerales archaeon]
MEIQNFLNEVKEKNHNEFERIDRLMKILDDLAEPEVVTITYSITSGNQ